MEYSFEVNFNNMMDFRFQKKSTLYFWRIYKKRDKKNLLAMYFNNNDEMTILHRLKLFSDKIVIYSESTKSEFLMDDLVLKKLRMNTSFFIRTNIILAIFQEITYLLEKN